MITFTIGVLILVFGYIFYSKYVEHVFGISDNETPAYSKQDNVDYVPISKNKNCLIHLLNIAGMGPIIGAQSKVYYSARLLLY